MNTISLCSGGVSDITIVSNIFIDKYMPSANGSFVKVYLYLLRILSDSSSNKELSISKIADQLDHTETDVLRALTYWEKVNLISLGRSANNEINSITINPLHSNITTNSSNIGYNNTNYKNTSSDTVTNSATVDTSIQNAISSQIPDDTLKNNKDLNFVISIAEKYVERMLSPNDEQLILYLYTKANFSPELILELYEYCASQGKKQYRYIESVASAWIKDGVTSAEQARANSENYNSAYSAVIKEFGINRSLGQAEKNYIDKWTKTYGFSTDIIKKACGKTIINIQKPDFKYTDKILTAWHQKNIKTIQDVNALDNNYNKSSSTSKKVARYSTPKTSNKFNSFSQRNYTSEELDELERRLLSR